MSTKKKISRRIGRAVCALALACLTSNVFAAGSPPQEMDSALAAQARAAREKGQTRIHALVQLHEIPGESQRNELSRQGLELGAYVTGRAWITAIPLDRATAVTHRPEVRSIEPWTADHKLHPRLAAGRISSWARDTEQPGWVAVMVLLHGDVDLGRGPALAELAGGSAGNPVEGLHGMSMWLPEANLTALAAEEEVLWIEQIPPPLSAANDGVRTQMKVNTVNSSPYDLDGKGVRLLFFDDGTVRSSHESFDPGTGSRVTMVNYAETSRHATSVAGTAAGDGSGSPSLRGRGVATGVEILTAGDSWSFSLPYWANSGSIEEDYATARSGHQADLVNNSLGSSLVANGAECELQGDYATTSALIDQIVRGDNPAVTGTMISVWAAGNEREVYYHGRCGGNYLTTAEPACAKNPIQVGAINSDGGSMTRFSSWGPCDDGRLKPTVVAPACESGRVTNESGVYTANCGDSGFDEGSYCDDDHLYMAEPTCGTSLAAPAVSGTIALLLQDWRQHLGSGFEDARLLPALVKAALIHTSRDLGAEGPDYRYGFGAVDAQALIDFERAAGLDALGGPGLKVWGTEQLSQSQADGFLLTVPTGIGELKASLAWDDFAAAPFATVALVNDLDLELLAPNGTVYRPFVLDPANPHLAATTGVNVVDNQEQVLMKNPQPGVWIVRVLGTSVPEGPQSYGLTYSAAPVAVSASCSEALANFEPVLGFWMMTGGAARVAAPGPGHGDYSARLGGANDNVSEVRRQIDLPLRQRSTWSFDLFMTTEELPWSNGFDEFSAEVRDVNGTVLSVVSFHNDGDVRSVWLPERNIDLSPWHGQTVYLAFRAVTNSQKPTTFWVDDVRVASCPSTTSVLTPDPLNPNGAQDGHVFESSENSSVGGTAVSNNSSPLGAATFQVGDSGPDLQLKGFVSFNTSALPDNAILVSARLVLNRSALVGTNPFTTHGACLVGIKTGGFNNSFTLEPGDFQAAATVQPVAVLSNPTVNGSYAYATLSSQGLAAIDKSGTTQLRIFFEQGDNDDLAGDALLFIAGEDANAALRPRLEVKYLLP